MHKTYLALVEGRVEPAEAMIDAPIGRDPNNRRRMAIDGAAPREAQTFGTACAIWGFQPHGPSDFHRTLVEASPITGRTHQIRASTRRRSAIRRSAMRFTAARVRKLLGRQFLHAWKLAFRMPLGGREVEFESPLPPDLRAVLEQLRGG